MGASHKKISKGLSISIFFVLFTAIFSMNSYNVSACGWLCPEWMWGCSACNDYIPKGFFDSADCNHISGWACDGDKYSQPLTVNFIVAGVKPNGTTINTIIPQQVAGRNRADLASACGGNTNHFFDFPTPTELKNDNKYSVTARVNDINSNGDTSESGKGIGQITSLGPCNAAVPDLSLSQPSLSIAKGIINNSVTIAGGTAPYTAASADETKVKSEIKEAQNPTSFSVSITGVDVTPTSSPVKITVTDKNGKTAIVEVTVTSESSDCTGPPPTTPACTLGLTYKCKNGVWKCTCGDIGWKTSPYWGGCSDCEGCGSQGCGKPEEYCDGTNWNTDFNPFVKQSDKATKTSGHACPCKSGGTLCSYPGTYNPGFPVSNPPITLKEKVGRAMMCKPPAAESMDYVVEQANILEANIKRHCCKPGGGFRDDTIDLPDGTIIDLISNVGAPNAAWQWSEPSAGSNCGNGVIDEGEDCEINPDNLNGATCASLGKGTGTLSCHSSGADACTYDFEQCTGGSCNNNGKCDTGEDSTTCPGDCPRNPLSCNDPQGIIPRISPANPITAKKTEIVKIAGTDLTSTVKLYTSTSEYSFTGSVNGACTETKFTVPNELASGRYTLKIRKASDKLSNGIDIDIKGKSTILKYTPDGDGSGYCDEDSQCLLNPNAKEGEQCINSGQYSDDNYCGNGDWTTRTKLLALKLLKLKSSDYVLFCDSKENALNNIQYLTDANEAASSSLASLQSNNFCVLKNRDKTIGAVSINKDLGTAAAQSVKVFGIADCSGGLANDGHYHACDSTNKVWYNKKLQSVIFGSGAITISSDQESSTFLGNLIQLITSSLKRLLTKPPYPPFDDSYLNGIKKFDRLYVSQQGSKSIIGSIEGKNFKNMLIEYNGVGTDVCSFIDRYNNKNNDTLSGISCKKEGSIYYVLGQGSQLTNLDPSNLWQDLTSKLRLS